MAAARIAIGAGTLALGLAVAGLMLSNEVRPATALDVLLVLAVAWSFAGSGLVAWQLRPGNAIGPAMVLTGVLRLVAGLFASQDPVLFSLGHVFEPSYLAGFVFLLLAFPTGVLGTRLLRAVFAATLVAAGPLHLSWLALGGHPHADRCVGCPEFLGVIVEARDAAAALELLHEVVGIAVVAVSIAILVRRWLDATAALRFAIAPVLWVGAVSFVANFLWLANGIFGDIAGDAPEVVRDLTLAAVPVSFLVGIGRTALARSAVADLVIGLAGRSAAGDLELDLARALRDPSLRIAYWLPEHDRYVDRNGRPVSFEGLDGRRAVTVIEHDGRRVAALIHDRAVESDDRLVRSVSAAAALRLENDRLHADLRAQLAEVLASRARIVEATHEERRRIERDLHDGTQQRLVSLAMTAGLADAKVASDPAAARQLIGELRSALSATLEEVRELAQGIHPAVLTERGLAGALDDLVLRMRLPVDLDVSVRERLAPSVESAAYYVVSESLTNIAKYANASRARVHVARRDGSAVVEVSDDGAGGADPARGSGLRGLRDRVEALGGRFTVTSPAGRGTVVTAELPCG